MTAVETAERSVPPAPEGHEETRDRVVRVRRDVRRRAALVMLAMGVLWFGLFTARVLLGDYTVTIPDFFSILFGEDIPVASFLVMESKLPRAVGATLSGIAFGVSGAVFQSMLRNPLASPDVIGVSVGASAAAVIAMVWLGLSGAPVALAAAVGGILVALAVLFLSGSRGTATIKLILVGIGLSAALTSVVQWVLITADIYAAQDAMLWLTGSLSSLTWSELARMAIAVVLLLPLVVALMARLRVLELGDDASQGLGVRATPSRLLLMTVTVLLTAVATSVVGPISFVALLCGPIARRLNQGRTSVLLAGLVGACLVLAADYAGTYLVGNVNMPVGVLTGIAGAPFLLWLLVASRRTTTNG